MPCSRPTWYLTHEYVGRNQTCDLQKLQVAPLTVPLLLEGLLQPGIGRCPLPGELGITVRELLGQPLISKRPLFRELAVRPGPLILDPPVCPPLTPDRYAYGGDRNGGSADCCKSIPDHARSLGSG